MNDDTPRPWPPLAPISPEALRDYAEGADAIDATVRDALFGPPVDDTPLFGGLADADIEVGRALLDGTTFADVCRFDVPAGWHTLAFCHLCAKSTPAVPPHEAVQWARDHAHPDRTNVYAFDPSILGRLDVLDRTRRVVPPTGQPLRVVDDGPPSIIGVDYYLGPPWAHRVPEGEITPNPNLGRPNYSRTYDRADGKVLAISLVFLAATVAIIIAMGFAW